MTTAIADIVDFIAAGPSVQSVAGFTVSKTTRERVADLIAREKTAGLTSEETSELDKFLILEHVMRLAKAKAARSQR